MTEVYVSSSDTLIVKLVNGYYEYSISPIEIKDSATMEHLPQFRLVRYAPIMYGDERVKDKNCIKCNTNDQLNYNDIHHKTIHCYKCKFTFDNR